MKIGALPVRAHRTRLRSTEVFAREGYFLWVRSPGVAAPETFPSIPPWLSTSLEGFRTGHGSRWVLGEGGAWARSYHLQGDRSLAERLIGARVSPGSTSMLALREVGVLLDKLHALPVGGDTASVPKRPASLGRLRGWFEEPLPGERLRRARAELCRQLGERGWDRLCAWADDVEEDREKVLCHGWFGVGRCVPHPREPAVEIIAGEDIGLAPPAFDLGLLVGELLEMRRFLPSPTETWELLLDELLEGYGRPLNTPVLRCAALGLLLHLHDFCVHTDSPLEGEIAPRADLIGVLLDRAA